MNPIKLLIDMVISMGLTLLARRIKRLPLIEVKEIFTALIDVGEEVLEAIDDLGPEGEQVTLEEATEVREAVENLIELIKNLLKEQVARYVG